MSSATSTARTEPWWHRPTFHDRAWLPGPRWARTAFGILFLWAAILRFWGWPHIPFTHDEISALVRIHTGLWDTIQKGVIELDTHPPGVQVFEWAWTKLFGFSEGAVKLPFLLMSLGTLLLVYRFAFAWTNATVALLLTALYATLQYTVMYGQIARPYAFGAFTIGLLADQWTRQLVHGTRATWWGMVIGAVGSAYAHHFALMVAALVLGSGLLLTRRRSYLIACATVMVLYLPNVPILLHQVGLGGLQEWLRAPGPWWIPDHLYWVAEYCPLLVAALVAVVAVSLWNGLRHPARDPFIPLMLIWGLVPLAIGLLYSVLRAPVLQHSMLLFSFPFLLLAFIGRFPKLKALPSMSIVLALAGIATVGLVFRRQHYATFYHSKYEAFLQAAVDHARDPNTQVWIDAPDEVLGLYANEPRYFATGGRYHRVRHTAAPAEIPATAVFDQVDTVVLCQFVSTTPVLPALVQAHFPTLVRRVDLVEGQLFTFAGQGEGIDDHRWTATYLPNARHTEAWRSDLPVVPHWWDTTAWALDMGGREFGLLYDALLALDRGTNDVLEATMTITTDASPSSGVVLELHTGDSLVAYANGRVRDCGFSRVAAAIKLADIDLPPGPLRLRAYAWNPEKGPARIGSMTVSQRIGDPVLYGLVEPIRDTWRFAPGRK
ncbi:MAG: glycosyltransferase family 39 protein [Flavobacteriales bacterium]|nr:glycosyltransferase family 39 protein [Flavobacteriales bacterium]